MKKVLFLFGELNDLDVDWLLANGCKEPVAEGKALIEEGKPIDALYIVLEGLFEVLIPGMDRQEIAALGPGEILGEMSFVDSRPPSSTVHASAPSAVYAIRRERLGAKLKQDTGFAARFYRALAMFLSHRLRRMTLKMSSRHPATRGPEKEAPDELDGQVLDSVYMAGRRFERMLRHASAS